MLVFGLSWGPGQRLRATELRHILLPGEPSRNRDSALRFGTFARTQLAAPTGPILKGEIMTESSLAKGFAAACFAVLSCVSASNAQISVSTYHNGNRRTG